MASSAASIAWLPICSALVSVRPPLFWRGARLAVALFRDPLAVLKPQLEPESRLCPPSLNVLLNAVHWEAPQQLVLAAIMVFFSVAVEPFDIEIALPELTALFPVKVL